MRRGLRRETKEVRQVLEAHSSAASRTPVGLRLATKCTALMEGGSCLIREARRSVTKGLSLLSNTIVLIFGYSPICCTNSSKKSAQYLQSYSPSRQSRFFLVIMKRKRKGKGDEKDLEEEGVDRVVDLEDLVDCDPKSESPQDLSLWHVQHLCHFLPFQLLLHVPVRQQ